MAAIVLSLGSVALVQGQRTALARQPTKVLSTHQVEGRFLGFCQGDYRHVGFQPKVGKARWFFVWDKAPDIDYFLATQKGEWVRAKFEVIDTFIPEAGGREVIEVLIDATTGTTSYSAWRKKEGWLFPGPGSDRERFEKLVSSLMGDCSGKAH